MARACTSKIVFCIAIALILSVSMIGVAYAAQNSNDGFSLWNWIKGLFGKGGITGNPTEECAYYCPGYPCGYDPYSNCEQICCGGGGGCTDYDGDGYGNPGDASCANGFLTDCDDSDVNFYPGATRTSDPNLPWGDTGICQVGIEGCDGQTGQPYVSQEKIVPSLESGARCNNGLDDDCDGLTDSSDPSCTSSFNFELPCSEFIANIEPAGFSTQRLPDIAMAPDGRFALAWYYVYAPLVGGNNVTAKFYRNNGTPLTSEIYNYLSPGTVTQPKIAMDANSNAVLVWHNVSGKILSQRFDSSGSKNGSIVLVSTNPNMSSYPDVAMDASGNFVVVWQSATTMANNDIRAQRFASNGTRLGSIFVVNTYTTNHQTIPDIAMDAQGNFAVTWMSVGQDGSLEGVYAQRFNSTGAYECNDRTYGLSCGTHGGNREFRVNSYTAGSQADQSIAMDLNGDFIIAWDGLGADDSYGIYAQRYDSKGNATGSNFRVNDVIAYAQDNPGVAMRNGTFIVTWSKDECDEYGSCDARATAKVYNGATPLTPEFPLSIGIANSDQYYSSVAMTESGYAVVWSGVTAISGTNEYPDVIVRASADRSCIQQPPTCIDNDGDGYGNPGDVSCSNGAQTDCNNSNAAIHPGATEICNGLDDDCDGSTDEGCCVDGDNDGYNVTGGACGVVDCNDANSAIYPGAIEVCNGVDDDCDSQTDEGIPSTPTNCGLGECYRTGTSSCVNGSMVDSCVPGAAGTEKCDSAPLNDEDCDGSSNEDCACNEGQTQNCGPETDVGECAFGTQICDINGLWGDCTGAVYPVNEICNGLDDDCNGLVDEGYVPTPTTCGVGACIASGELICLNGNETNTCNPGIPAENDATCNGIDDDCSGLTDEDYVETSITCGEGLCTNNTGKLICVSGTPQEACTPLPPVKVYQDFDIDSYGNPFVTQDVCTIPDGYIITDEDCNDGDATINPGADDICDANHNVIDKDCDATNNGELDCNDFCGDIDGDGYVTPEKYGEWGGVIPSIICPWIIDDGDCNDGDAAVHPGVADAVCNGVDDNCDGNIDEGYVPTPTSCGVGACASTGQLVCISGTVNNTCIPGTPAPETCNGIDDNCNGVVDDADADADGLNDCTNDQCPGSVADNIALNPNQYAQNNFATSAFESGPSNDQSIVYNMQNTKGCTCKQIVAELGIGIGQIKKGCAPGIMQRWTGIDQNPDRVAGIGKK